MLLANLVILVNVVSVFSATLAKVYSGIDADIEKPFLPNPPGIEVFTRHRNVPRPVLENSDTLTETMAYMSDTRKDLEKTWGEQHDQVASGVDKELLTPMLPPKPVPLMERIWNTIKRWFGINRLTAAFQRRAAIRDLGQALEYEMMVIRDFKEGKGKQVNGDVDKWIQAIEDAVVHQSRAKIAGYGRIDLGNSDRYLDQLIRRVMYS